jgi:hypothetical protein
MLQKANVSHGKTKMERWRDGEMERWREFPCDRRSSMLYRGRFVCGAVLVLSERKKKWCRSKEGAKKRFEKKTANLSSSSGT